MVPEEMLKKEDNLFCTTYFYYSMFGHRIEADIIAKILGYDAILITTDITYQAATKAIEVNNCDGPSEISNKKISKDIFSYMKTSLKILNETTFMY